MPHDWKHRLGLALFVYSFLVYGIAAGLPWLGLSGKLTAVLAAAVIVTGEVAFLTSAVLLGKPFIQAVKSKIKAFFKQTIPAQPRPIGRPRHYIGVTLFCGSFLPYLVAELMLVAGFTHARHISLIIGMLVSSDAVFIISLFILGSDFIDRLNHVFAWPRDSDRKQCGGAMNAVVAERGQVTIPKPIRDRLGLSPHTVVCFTEERGHVVMTKVLKHDAVAAVQGCLKLKRSTDDILIELRGGA